MIKKLFTAALALVLVMGLTVPCFALDTYAKFNNGIKAVKTPENNISTRIEYGSYEYDIENGGAVIYAYYGQDKNLTIPSKIDGYQVTAIASYAFSFNESIVNLVIPEGVTTIECGAFEYCTALEKVTIPKSVEVIEYAVFSGAEKLKKIEANSDNLCYTSIDGVLFNKDVTELIAYPVGKSQTEYTVPSTVKLIGVSAFDYAKLESITFPDGLEVIDDDAFWDCDKLTSISFPNSLTKVGAYAFYSCDFLKEIAISKNVEFIGEYAFCDSASLENINVDSENSNYYSEDGVLFNKEKTVLIVYPAGKTAESYIIPETVTKIGAGSLGGNIYLKTVTLHENLTTIEGWAFDSSIALTEINIPASVMEIGDDVFRYCIALININVDDNNTAFCDIDGVLYTKTKKTLIAYPAGRTETEYTVPTGTEVIGYDSFVCASNLQYVTLPNTVDTIESCAFDGCDALLGIYIPESVTNIDDYVFSSENLTIYCESGSVAETYAINNAIPTKEGPINIEGEITPTPTAEPTLTPEITPTIAPTTEPTPEATLEPTPEPTTTPNEGGILGDINADGKVNSRDIASLQKVLLGILVLTEQETVVADYTCDGKVNSRDIAALQRQIVS